MEGAYNLRIIEYANGTVELRRYDSPINAVYDGETSVVPIYQQGKKRNVELEYNPFTEQFEQLRTLQDAERSAKNSLNRTKQALYQYSRQGNWEFFITLTFDGDKVDRYDFDLCMKKANIWFNHQRTRSASDLMYLFVPEQHKDGAWHIHGVIANVGDMKIEDSGRVAIGKNSYVRTDKNSHYPTIYNLSGWRFGWSTATKVRDNHKVVTYITKYITKDLCKVTKGKKRYYHSKNIPEPIEHGYLVESCDVEEFIRTFENSLDCELVYSKEINGQYQSVNYRYYQKESEVKKE